VGSKIQEAVQVSLQKQGMKQQSLQQEMLGEKILTQVATAWMTLEVSNDLPDLVQPLSWV
jgi:hypothetical protein